MMYKKKSFLQYVIPILSGSLLAWTSCNKSHLTEGEVSNKVSSSSKFNKTKDVKNTSLHGNTNPNSVGNGDMAPSLYSVSKNSTQGTAGSVHGNTNPGNNVMAPSLDSVPANNTQGTAGSVHGNTNPGNNVMAPSLDSVSENNTQRTEESAHDNINPITISFAVADGVMSLSPDSANKQLIPPPPPLSQEMLDASFKKKQAKDKAAAEAKQDQAAPATPSRVSKPGATGKKSSAAVSSLDSVAGEISREIARRIKLKSPLSQNRSKKSLEELERAK